MTNPIPRPMVPVTQILTAVLQVAAEHHRAGRRADAAALYNEVLALDPRHADALFLVAVLAREAGELEQAHGLLYSARRWAASRTRIDAELRLVEPLLERRNCKHPQPWRSSAQLRLQGVVAASTARA